MDTAVTCRASKKKLGDENKTEFAYNRLDVTLPTSKATEVRLATAMAGNNATTRADDVAPTALMATPAPTPCLRQRRRQSRPHL